MLDEINRSADEMRNSNHGESSAIASRQKEINDMWQHMMQLKLDREKTLEGASRFGIQTML